MTGLASFILDPSWLLWAQAAKPPGGLEALFRSGMPLVIFLGIMAYFMLIRPESQRKAEHAKLIENLKKHDRVVTIGGIHGSVASVQKGSAEVTILIDENTNTKIRVLRSAVSRLIDKDKDKNKGDKNKGADE